MGDAVALRGVVYRRIGGEICPDLKIEHSVDIRPLFIITEKKGWPKTKYPPQKCLQEQV